MNINCNYCRIKHLLKFNYPCAIKLVGLIIWLEHLSRLLITECICPSQVDLHTNMKVFHSICKLIAVNHNYYQHSSIILFRACYLYTGMAIIYRLRGELQSISVCYTNVWFAQNKVLVLVSIVHRLNGGCSKLFNRKLEC